MDELLESADVVLGLGGGAVLDLAKAIAAMVPLKSENLAQTERFLLGAFACIVHHVEVYNQYKNIIGDIYSIHIILYIDI